MIEEDLRAYGVVDSTSVLPADAYSQTCLFHPMFDLLAHTYSRMTSSTCPDFVYAAGAFGPGGRGTGVHRQELLLTINKMD